MIANVQTSLQIEENQSSTVTILVATSGNYDEPITLAVADGQSRIAVSEAIDFSTNEQQAVELEIPGYSIGDHLLFAQIEDKNGAVLDSRPFTLNVMSPELYAAVSASTSQENDENADHVDEDKVFVPSATSGENVSKGVYIGFASVIVLIGLGGGFTLLRRDQKGVAGASVAGSIIFAAGLMYIGMGKMSAPEVPSPTTQPTASAQQELSMVSLDTIEKDIASTAAALVAFLPTATPTPLPTTTSTPEPTFTPTPVGRGERLEIGKTVTGQTIEAIRFGDGSNVIVIVGGIHAGTAPSSVQIAQQLGSYYLTNPDRLPGHITLYIIENLNLDSIYAPGNIRGRFNSNGVDLNRNWDCRWEADVDVFGEFVVGAGGDEPFSEPESQALKSFIEEVNPELVLFYEARATNGYVVPGGCNVRHEPSESFSVNYANAAGYRLADFEEVISDTIHGDASNYFASIDIPSIFVILPHYELVNLAENVNGLNTVMEQID